MPPSDSGLSRQAIGWALLGQLIWLPLVGIAVQDRWLSAPPSRASAAVGSTARLPASASPLSLGDLEAASGTAQRRPDPAAEAVSPAAPSSVGLVLRSPGGIGALPAGLPAGSPQASAVVAGPGPSALAAEPAGGSPITAGGFQPRPSPQPGQQAERRAAVRSDPSLPALLAGGAPRQSDSLSQLLGGAIGLRDLSRAPIGAVASHRAGSAVGLPAGDRRSGQGAAASAGGPAGRPASRVWMPPPPLPPLP